MNEKIKFVYCWMNINNKSNTPITWPFETGFGKQSMVNTIENELNISFHDKRWILHNGHDKLASYLNFQGIKYE